MARDRHGDPGAGLAIRARPHRRAPRDAPRRRGVVGVHARSLSERVHRARERDEVPPELLPQGVALRDILSVPGPAL